MGQEENKDKKFSKSKRMVCWVPLFFAAFLESSFLGQLNFGVFCLYLKQTICL